MVLIQRSGEISIFSRVLFPLLSYIMHGSRPIHGAWVVANVALIAGSEGLLLETIYVGGLEGNFRKQGLSSGIQSRLEAFAIPSSKLFQYGTTRTLNACWQRRLLHHCWWILPSQNNSYFANQLLNSSSLLSILTLLHLSIFLDKRSNQNTVMRPLQRRPGSTEFRPGWDTAHALTKPAASDVRITV